MATNRKTALVVGAGFGGLAAAFQALAKGYRVVVLEAGDQPGGRARVFRTGPYQFDAGPTVITAPYLFDELFALIGERSQEWMTLLPVDPFYRIEYPDGARFDYVGDEERLIENIRQLSPQDVDGYQRLARHARDIFEVGYARLADQPFDTLASMLRVVPDMIRLQNYRSVYALVSKYIKDERLRQAFSFEPLLVGGNPFRCTSIYLLIHWLERKWGVHFVKGGTTALVKALCGALEKKGVEFHYGASVDTVEVSAGSVRRVRCKDGSRYECDVLISNADPIKTYTEWINPRWIRKHRPRRLQAKQQSMSLFVAYFGSKKRYTNLAHHTIVMGPRYKELLHDIFDRKVLADDFSLYLHAPSITDPSIAPKGHEAFYVLSPVPNNQSGINWEKEELAYRAKILDHLEERLLPGLRENIDCEFSVTPNYFEHDLQSSAGAAFGIEPTFRQSAYFRFHNSSEDVRGLYFVGANTHPGAGIPGVLNSAKVLHKVLPQAAELV